MDDVKKQLQAFLSGFWAGVVEYYYILLLLILYNVLKNSLLYIYISPFLEYI